MHHRPTTAVRFSYPLLQNQIDVVSLLPTCALFVRILLRCVAREAQVKYSNLEVSACRRTIPRARESERARRRQQIMGDEIYSVAQTQHSTSFARERSTWKDATTSYGPKN